MRLGVGPFRSTPGYRVGKEVDEICPSCPYYHKMNQTNSHILLDPTYAAILSKTWRKSAS